MADSDRVIQTHAVSVEEFNDRLRKRTVFIAELNPATTAETLRPSLETFGAVIDLKVLYYKETGCSK